MTPDDYSFKGYDDTYEIAPHCDDDRWSGGFEQLIWGGA